MWREGGRSCATGVFKLCETTGIAGGAPASNAGAGLDGLRCRGNRRAIRCDRQTTGTVQAVQRGKFRVIAQISFRTRNNTLPPSNRMSIVYAYFYIAPYVIYPSQAMPPKDQLSSRYLCIARPLLTVCGEKLRICWGSATAIPII